MIFHRENLIGLPELVAYAAEAKPWQFLILQDMEKWTASYRLIAPRDDVSASSTIMGPFDSFAEAETAAQDKLRELKRLA